MLLFISADVKQLEGWVRSEAGRYATILEQRHHLEIDAFVEQLRLKDEKLEAFRWRLLSMELESKRLQSHAEGLNKDISQLRHNNVKMEAMVLEREEELNSLKEQFASQLRSLNFQNNLNSSLHDSAAANDSIWPQVKIIKRLPGEEEQETKTNFIEMSQGDGAEREEGISALDVLVQSPDKKFEEQKEVSHQDPTGKGNASLVEIDAAENLASPTQQALNKTNSSPWRMDLHALGVSYKIKRLKQQLLMLERLTGKQESGEDMESSDREIGIKGFLLLMSFLNKQVGRYQSLQGKVDDLCKRMVSLCNEFFKVITSLVAIFTMMLLMVLDLKCFLYFLSTISVKFMKLRFLITLEKNILMLVKRRISFDFTL